MILNDRQLKSIESLVSPFVESQQSNGVVSYGLSSFGYDARVSEEFEIFDNPDGNIIDIKRFRSNSRREYGDIILPPNSFALARTVEYFKLPNDVVSLCVGKSSYARCGLHVLVTPLEPGWEGHVTLELANMTPLPIKVYANEGIAQFLFFRGERPEVTYADRKGKYQKQTGITFPKVLKDK